MYKPFDPPAPDPADVPATRFDAAAALELSFPPLPRTVAEVSAMVAERQDIPDTPRLVAVVNDDPLVATSVLRRVNSAYYGLRRRVGDLRQAVFLLGFPEVTDLVISAAMMRLRDVLRGPEQEEIFEQLMRLSVGAAAYTRLLGEHLELAEAKKAFTLGLLSNVGRLMMLYNIPEEYEALWFTNEIGVAPGPVPERKIFGVDHAQMAAMALIEWKLPDFYVEVLGHYLMPERLSDAPMRHMALALAAGLHATEHLCMTDGNPAKYEAPDALAALAREAGAPADDLRTLIVDGIAQVKEYIDTALVG